MFFMTKEEIRLQSIQNIKSTIILLKEKGKKVTAKNVVEYASTPISKRTVDTY